MPSHQSLAQRAYPILHVLRYPLIASNIAGVTIASLDIRNHRRDYNAASPFLVLAVSTFAISLAHNTILSLRQLITRTIKLPDNDEEEEEEIVVKESAILIAFFDLAIAILFIIVYVATNIIVSENSRWESPTLTQFITGGALVAWALHLCLAFIPLYLWYKASTKVGPRCPHCHHQESRGFFTRIRSGSARLEGSGHEQDTRRQEPDEESTSEGARLLVPGPEE